jgi:transcriptional regulator with XRE-family HTH domain
MSTVEAPNRRARSVGQRITLARQEADMTVKELAEGLQVSVWTVEQLERGEVDVFPRLAGIAAATGRPPVWFVTGHSSVGPEEADAEGPGGEVSETPLAAANARTADRNLVLTSLALLLVIRFATEAIDVLPNFAGFVDIPILIVLVVAAGLRQTDSPTHRTAQRLVPPAMAFLLLCVISAAANPSRVAIAPAVLFIYGMLGPLIVYFSVYRLWPSGNAAVFSRLLVSLLLVQLVVVVVFDLPRFVASSNPDVISGTFGTNAYQLVFFLLVAAALLAGIFTFEPGRAMARFAPVLLACIFLVVLLAQFRALLFTTVLTVVLVGVLVGTSRSRGVAAGFFGLISFVLVLSYVASAFPFLKFNQDLGTLNREPGKYFTDRLHAVDPVGQLFNDNALFIATGTGPGTFSSRGWYTFAVSDSKSRSNTAGPIARKLTGGIYHTDVSDKYVLPQLERGAALNGSTAVSSPRSSSWDWF